MLKNGLIYYNNKLGLKGLIEPIMDTLTNCMNTIRKLKQWVYTA